LTSEQRIQLAKDLRSLLLTDTLYIHWLLTSHKVFDNRTSLDILIHNPEIWEKALNDITYGVN
jgi:hypothetical protein